MKAPLPATRKLRCAVYTRKSTEEAGSGAGVQLAWMPSVRLARHISLAKKAEGWVPGAGPL